jgi:glucose-1-phosphate cytidylyltransferase
MKVVLFCGGFGLRMRPYSEEAPKPMVHLGYRPILWHLMKYYAHFGHSEFILCLGWKGDAVKRYFLEYDECLSNDFVLRNGEAHVLQRDIEDWRIRFVDTGVNASIGERLKAVEPLVRGEEAFLANYTDALTDLPLTGMIDAFRQERPAGMFLSVRPRHSFHAVESGPSGRVSGFGPIERTPVWMNGGFFVLTPEVFDYLLPGEDLVEQPFQRMIEAGRLHTYRYEGFWSCMDTYKEVQTMEEMVERGTAPWTVWNRTPPGNGRAQVLGVAAAEGP